MSSTSQFISWEAGCTYHPQNLCESGMRAWHFDYSQPYPCPNGLGIDHRSPRDVPLIVARIAKARKDSDDWAAQCRVRCAADEITIDELSHDIEEIRKWAQSLRRTQRSGSGSIG